MGEATVEGLSTFCTAITGALGDFSVSNLQTVMTSALGITVGLAVAWFAYRFVVKRVSKAMKSGRV